MTGRSGISSFKGLDKKHQAIAKTVFQVLTESATVADAKCRLCQIKGDPVSLAEVQEPEGLNGQSAKPLSGLRGTEGSNSSSSTSENLTFSISRLEPGKPRTASCPSQTRDG